MRGSLRSPLVALAATLFLFGAAPALSAQRAGESGGWLDLKSGRFANIFSTGPVRAPDTLAVTDARAFGALPAVFAALAVPISIVDSANQAMGAVRVAARRPIAGQRLSLLVECGTGNYGPNAERYALQLTLVAIVKAVDSTHTAVQTRVEGNASPNGLSTTVRCASTGQLEERFVELLRKELGL